MSEWEDGKRMAQFQKVEGRKPLDHVDDERCDKTDHQQGMGNPAVKGLAEELKFI